MTTTQSSYEQIKPLASSLRQRVLAYILDCGKYGATDEEIQLGLEMNPSTQRPRRVELVNFGLIHPQGTRKTHSGRNAQIWIVCENKNIPASCPPPAPCSEE